MKQSTTKTGVVPVHLHGGPVYASSVQALYDDPKALFVGKLAVFSRLLPSGTALPIR